MSVASDYEFLNLSIGSAKTNRSLRDSLQGLVVIEEPISLEKYTGNEENRVLTFSGKRVCKLTESAL